MFYGILITVLTLCWMKYSYATADVDVRQRQCYTCGGPLLGGPRKEDKVTMIGYDSMELCKQNQTVVKCDFTNDMCYTATIDGKGYKGCLTPTFSVCLDVKFDKANTVCSENQCSGDLCNTSHSCQPWAVTLVVTAFVTARRGLSK